MTDLSSIFCSDCSEQQTTMIHMPRWNSNSSLSAWNK